MDKNQMTESASKIQVVHGDRSKNFDLSDALFLGGIPETVYLRWREKLGQRHGFQYAIRNCSCSVNVFDPSITCQFRFTAGTTLSFGRLELEEAEDSQSSTEKLVKPKRLDSTGYLRITYTDSPRNTEVDEFVLGIQTTPLRDEKPMRTTQNNLATLMFITNNAVTGDFMHLYMVSDKK
ncbi:hypothetical protein AHF37_01444 [Paragonimus kellicotti]|nr:hypothetical protein AHF37_01444 [Paragonimus kellicotti]